MCPPLYEFHCQVCDALFESLMKPTDPVQCAVCLSKDCVKQITSHKDYKISGDNSASTRPGAK